MSCTRHRVSEGKTVKAFFNLFFFISCLLNRAQGAGAAERARVLEEFWNRKRDAQRNRARGQVRWVIGREIKN